MAHSLDFGELAREWIMAMAIRRPGRLLGACAVLMGAALLAGPPSEAGNRKAYKKLRESAENYCKNIKEQELYDCSVEKCPCEEGLRAVRKFDKLRTRGACVCASPVAWVAVNRASATDYCIEWNYRQASDGDRCFVVAGNRCPTGTRELNRFALADHGPSRLACRGTPPEPEDEDGGKIEGKSKREAAED